MPTFTIISNANAIIKNLATPVLVDVDLNTWNKLPIKIGTYIFPYNILLL